MSKEAVIVKHALDFYYKEFSDALLLELRDSSIRAEFGISVNFSLRESTVRGVTVKDFSKLCCRLYSKFTRFFDAELEEVIQELSCLSPVLSTLAKTRLELGI